VIAKHAGITRSDLPIIQHAKRFETGVAIIRRDTRSAWERHFCAKVPVHAADTAIYDNVGVKQPNLDTLKSRSLALIPSINGHGHWYRRCSAPTRQGLEARLIAVPWSPY
jgi:hypothetical protein